MNLVLNVNFSKKLENGDILIYVNGEWINLSKDEYLGKLTNKVNELENKVNELENTIKNLEKSNKELRGED